jgi:hypothetical protein
MMPLSNRSSHAQTHIPGAKEAAEKVAAWAKSVPQRLKPDCKASTHGTDKSVPLSKTEANPSFSASSKALVLAGLDVRAKARTYLTGCCCRP